MRDDMRKILLLLAVTLCFWRLPVSAQENLVRNSGFEEKAAASGLPGGGWWLYEGNGRTITKTDLNVAHGGSASVQLHADEESKCVLVSAPFEVAPGDEMKFQVWVKGAGITTNHPATFAGLAFRRKDGTVFQRNYFQSAALGGERAMISGTAQAPADATSAEVHLGYTNAPGTVWFDDVLAVITSPMSLSLVEGAKLWPGAQEITVRVANREAGEFRGSVTCIIGKEVSTVPVVLAAKAAGEFKLPITLKMVGQHDYKIRLLDAGGTQLRLLQGKFRTAAALALFPPCQYYHLVGEGNGDTRIDVRVNLNPAERNGLKLRVELMDAGGNQIQAATADASQGELAGLNLRVPVDQPGTFGIVARLLGADGRELAMEKSEVHCALENSAKVTMGADGFLRVNGAPNFPIGLYNSGHDEEMAAAGFNATHNYGITTGEANEAINPNDTELAAMLDKAWASGLRMMVELPRKAIEQGKWEQVRRRVQTFKHHPGLLCWGSEERVARGNAPLSRIAALYKLVHELDPDHPFVLGDTKDVIQKFKVDRRDFFRTKIWMRGFGGGIRFR